jgi:hypothetical protein
MNNEMEVICAGCGTCRPLDLGYCPDCESESSFRDKWWYEKPIPDNGIHGKVLSDGQKIIPKFFVEVRAYLHPHPNGDPLSSWAVAEEYFRNHGGWKWIEDEIWYRLCFRREREI